MTGRQLVRTVTDMGKITMAAAGLVALAAALLAGCGPAHGTVKVESGRLIFTAAAGKANDVLITAFQGQLRINDSGDTITPGTGCTSHDPHTALCEMASDVVAELKDGDDSFANITNVSSGRISNELGGINGGPGDDVLSGSSGPDFLYGESGDDHLDGNGGNDGLIEGSDPAAVDALDADTYEGGPGNDLVSYGRGTQPVVVDLDGIRDDGQVGEGDLVETDVERLTGSDGDDDLIGDADDNIIDGNRGDDTVVGNAGKDMLIGGIDGDDELVEGIGAPATDVLDADTYLGGSGSDEVTYRDGNGDVVVDLDGVADDGRTGEADKVFAGVEDLTGGNGADNLSGDGGPNLLQGGGGPDELFGAGGDDVLRGGPGLDQLNGGTEADDCDVGLDGGSEKNCEI